MAKNDESGYGVFITNHDDHLNYLWFLRQRKTVVFFSCSVHEPSSDICLCHEIVQGGAINMLVIH